MEGLSYSCFHFPNQQRRYQGKVRDVYDLGDHLVMVVSDRISAFDHILPRAIPYKGQVLNGIATQFLRDTAQIVPNWLMSSPHPNVSIGRKCDPIPIEMVVRGYLVGHAWRTYNSGLRSLCGVPLPEGLVQNQAFAHPIITPATKATEGHDIDISRQDIIGQGIVSESIYTKMEEYSLKLFNFGTQYAAEKGLLLVDTKYEFGIFDGQVYLIDEIHTPDSSRYFIADGYEQRLDQGDRQKQLSKEFVREWLMDNGFMGRENDTMPVMSDDMVQMTSLRYIELYERLLGKTFVKTEYQNILPNIYHATKRALLDKN